MYLELFRLKELPFRLSPDPQFLYLSKHHARAKAYMESTVWFTDGFVVLTGEIGSGKTTLVETFLHELDKDVVVAQINQTQVSPIAFLQSVLVQFGFAPFKMRKAELLATLTQFLVEQYAAGRKVLLVVDEAQNLSNRVLEEIRMLSGVETTKDKTLRIILAGQPELLAKLNSPELVQLAQRIRLRFHLTPLSKPDVYAYVDHRLQVAGADGRTIFSDDAKMLIARYTGGIPRLINTLCDTAMMGAFAIEKDHVDAADVQNAVDELQWVEYGTPTNRLPIVQVGLPVLRQVSPETVLGRVWVTDHLREGIEARTHHHRAHARERHADRLQVCQPPPLPADGDRRGDAARGPEQHQRHLHAGTARTAPPARRWRRRADWPPRAALHGRAPGPHPPRVGDHHRAGRCGGHRPAGSDQGAARRAARLAHSSSERESYFAVSWRNERRLSLSTTPATTQATPATSAMVLAPL
jgi:type II secretory pathway predicted ATPase ExeA